MNTKQTSARLEEVLTDIIDYRGRTPKKLGGDFSSSGVPVISAKNVKSGGLDFSEGFRFVSPEMYERWMTKKLMQGDVLLTSEAPLGEAAILTNDTNYCLGQRLYALRPDPTKLDSLFFYFLLISESVQRELKGKATGSTAKGIKQSSLRKVKCQFPTLPIQRTIAKILQTIQEAKAVRQKEIELERERKATLKDYFVMYGIRGEARKQTEIGEIPKTWEVIELNKIVKESIKDGVHKTPKYVEKGIPFITAKDIIDNKITFSQCSHISMEEHISLIKRVKPEIGDVLLTKVGTVGNVALVDMDKEFSIFVQVALLKPKLNTVDSEFLFYVLQSNKVQNEIHKKSAQSTMRFIGVQKIATVLIPLPPLHEQSEIASVLCACDNKIETLEREIDLLNEFFWAMLYELMTGHLSSTPLN